MTVGDLIGERARVLGLGDAHDDARDAAMRKRPTSGGERIDRERRERDQVERAGVERADRADRVEHERALAEHAPGRALERAAGVGDDDATGRSGRTGARPSSASSRRTPSESDGWATPIAAAPAVKLPWSMTASTYSTAGRQVSIGKSDDIGSPQRLDR